MDVRSLTYSVLIVLSLSGFAATSASAATISLDSGPGQSVTGQVAYYGDGGPLTGNNITFGAINAGPNSVKNSLTCSQLCALNFTTGDYVSSSSGNYKFGSGGTLTVNGTVVDNNNTTVASGLLLKGTFTDTPSTTQKGPMGQVQSDNLSVMTNGTNQVANSLLNALGLDSESDFIFKNNEMGLGQASYASDGSFYANITSADFSSSTLKGNAVSEPSELGIFGLGLLLLLVGLPICRSPRYLKRSSAV